MNNTEQLQEPWATFERSVPGWFRVTATDDVDFEVYVGAVIEGTGHAVITGLAITGRALTTSDLRTIPLGRIQAALRDPHLRDWVQKTAVSGDPLAVLQETADEGPDYVYRPADVRPRLSRPNGKDPNAFYRLVSTAYTEYALQSTQPAVRIADEAGVPPNTARRWINRARELGLLERGGRPPRK